MKNWTSYIVILFFSFQSCERKESKYIFDEKPISNLQNAKIQDVIILENNQNAKERKNVVVENLGLIYSGVENLNRKVYDRNDANLLLKTDYYYDKKDTTLKIIFYTWRTKTLQNVNNKKIKSQNIANYKIIKEKYNILKKLLSKQLKIKPKTLLYLDTTLWETKNVGVFITIINTKTENPEIFLHIQSKKNGL